MYLDTKGYVTIGVGHLLRTAQVAQGLPFYKSDETKANADDIKEDFEEVKKQSPGRLAASYKKYTKLIMKSADIDALTDKHIVSFESELKKIYSNFNSYPPEVKFALFDMIFNLGMFKLRNSWPTFNKAIADMDWQAAANSSGRVGIQPGRNKYVKDLLEKAAKESKESKAKTEQAG